MGDRSQIAIKQPTEKDPDAAVYLYGHWIGAEIYPTLQKVIKAGQRLDDAEYLTRIIAREMGMGADGETGYGIGNGPHGDVEHIIPVLDCDAGTITFENTECAPNKNGKAYTFAEFAALPASHFAEW